MGAMYGIGGLNTSNWGRAFDILILCQASSSAASSCEAVFDRFLQELKYGPLYFSLQDEELQRVRQIQLQGAMTRQQNAIQASPCGGIDARTLADTLLCLQNNPDITGVVCCMPPHPHAKPP